MRCKSIFALVILSFQLFALAYPVSAEMVEVEKASFTLIDVRWGMPGEAVLEPKPGDSMVPLTITLAHTAPHEITDLTAELWFRGWYFEGSTGEDRIYSSVTGSYGASERMDFVFTINIDDGAELGTYDTSMWIEYRFTSEEKRNRGYVKVPIKLPGSPTVNHLLYPQKLNPGEVNDITLVVTNNGSAPAYSLHSSFSAEMMVPVDSETSWTIPRLLPSENVTLPFRLYVHPDLQDQVAQGEVTTTYDTAYGNTWTENKEVSFVVGSFSTNLFKASASTALLTESRINDLTLTLTYLGTSPLGDVEVSATVAPPAVIVEEDHWVIEQLNLNQQFSLPIKIYAPSAGQYTTLSIAIKHADVMGVKYTDELGEETTEAKQFSFIVVPIERGSISLKLESLDVKADAVNEAVVRLVNDNQKLINVEVTVEAAQPFGIVGLNSWNIASLMPDESEELTFGIYAPSSSVGSTGSMTFTVKYVDEWGDSETETQFLGFAVLETLQPQVELTSTFPYTSMEMGNTVQYPITITNVGGSDKLFILSVSSSPGDWEVVFKSGALEVQSIFLTAGQSQTLIGEVIPSEDAMAGLYSIVIQAESEDGGAKASLGLMVKLNEAEAEWSPLDVSTDIFILTAGKINRPIITIGNSGESSVKTVEVMISTEESRVETVSPMVLTSGTERWLFEAIKPGTNMTVTPEVFPSLDSADTSQTMTISISYLDSLGDLHEESRTIRFTVKGTIIIAVQGAKTSPASVSAGEDFTITGDLLNKGNTEGLYSTLSLKSSPYFVESEGTQYIGDLRSNMLIPFSFPVEANRNAEEGTYPVTAVLTYEDSYGETFSEEITVQVSISKAIIQPTQTQADASGASALFGTLFLAALVAIVGGGVISIFKVYRGRKRTMES